MTIVNEESFSDSGISWFSHFKMGFLNKYDSVSINPTGRGWSINIKGSSYTMFWFYMLSVSWDNFWSELVINKMESSPTLSACSEVFHWGGKDKRRLVVLLERLFRFLLGVIHHFHTRSRLGLIPAAPRSLPASEPSSITAHRVEQRRTRSGPTKASCPGPATSSRRVFLSNGCEVKAGGRWSVPLLLSRSSPRVQTFRTASCLYAQNGGRDGTGTHLRWEPDPLCSFSLRLTSKSLYRILF